MLSLPVLRNKASAGRTLGGVLAAALLIGSAGSLLVPTAASAATTSVTVAGSFQSELGCSGDWDPTCALSHLSLAANDGVVWKNAFSLPAGSYEYKVAVNDSWVENYGAHAQADGQNVSLAVPGPSPAVRVFYDDTTHWVADDVNAVIATAPGSFQSELGCSGDWDPTCMRSWLEDPDGDGTYSFLTTALPAGSYETKVAIDTAWDENYGAGGVRGGANVAFTVATANAPTLFSYDATTHVLTVGPPPPPSVTVTAPNGGERVRHGTTTTITWSRTGSLPDDVEIALLRKGKLVGVLAASTSLAAGSYSWAVPADFPGGKGFRIRVTALGASPAVSDVSDGDFSIQ